MTVFATSGHLVSWAGTAPRANESAGKAKPTGTRPGNRSLKRALGTAALSASLSPTTYLGAKYRRTKSARGPMKALVAIQHSMPNHHLAHANQRRNLHRPRAGLLHPPKARPDRDPRHSPA